MVATTIRTSSAAEPDRQHPVGVRVRAIRDAQRRRLRSASPRVRCRRGATRRSRIATMSAKIRRTRRPFRSRPYARPRISIGPRASPTRIGIAVPATTASGRAAGDRRDQQQERQAEPRRVATPVDPGVVADRAEPGERESEDGRADEHDRGDERVGEEPRPRYGSAIIPPKRAANASPGTPSASSRVSVPSASGRRAWANPRSIASPARSPAGCAASAGPIPAARLARAAPDASVPSETGDDHESEGDGRPATTETRDQGVGERSRRWPRRARARRSRAADRGA